MKVLEIKILQFPEIKVIRFARFQDDRGYFAEPYRKSDFLHCLEVDVIKGREFMQCNESFSKTGTIRGLHFQWSPYMGKLVRTLQGGMVDMVLDIRKGSPTFGKIIGYPMPANNSTGYGEWIWVPPGFAHGNFFTEDSVIEYFCTGEYNPSCEAGISPLAPDIDWSLFEPKLKKLFDAAAAKTKLITDKDKNGYSVKRWEEDSRSDHFIHTTRKI